MRGQKTTTTILEVTKSLLEPVNRPPAQRRPRVCHLAFNITTKEDAKKKYSAAGVDSYIDTRTVNSWAYVLLSRTKYKNRPKDGTNGMAFNSEFEIKQSWRELAAFLAIPIEANMPRVAAERRAGHKACYAWKTVVRYCQSKSENIESWHIARLRKKPPKSMLHLSEVPDEEWIRYAKELYKASANLEERRVSFTQEVMMKEVQLHLKANPELVPPFLLVQYERIFQDYSGAQSPPDFYMIDESQDIDECSFDIIRTAACRGKSVLLWIGDSRQTIYQFKGARNCWVKRWRRFIRL